MIKHLKNKQKSVRITHLHRKKLREKNTTLQKVFDAHAKFIIDSQLKTEQPISINDKTFQTSIRYSTTLGDELESLGWTVQSVVDAALILLFQTEYE